MSPDSILFRSGVIAFDWQFRRKKLGICGPKLWTWEHSAPLPFILEVLQVGTGAPVLLGTGELRSLVHFEVH